MGKEEWCEKSQRLARLGVSARPEHPPVRGTRGQVQNRPGSHELGAWGSHGETLPAVLAAGNDYQESR